MKTRIFNAVLENIEPETSDEPYWFHAKILDEVVQFQDDAVWAIRDLVRQTELVHCLISKAVSHD